MEVVPEEKERGKILRNSVNSLQPFIKRGQNSKKATKSKSQSKYVFDTNTRQQRKSGLAEKQSNLLNVKDPLKNIQLKNGLKNEGSTRITDKIKGQNGYNGRNLVSRGGEGDYGNQREQMSD